MDWNFKNYKVKAIIIGSILILVSCLIFIVKVQYDTIARLKSIETSVVESKDIGNGIIRAQSAYVTQNDLERLLKEQNINIESIKNDLKTLGADIQGVNTISVVTPGYNGNNLPTTNTTPNPNPVNQINNDPNGYFKNQQWFALTEPFNNNTIPFGKVGFSAWQDKPWSLEVLPRKYESITVLGQDEDGRHYAYSKFQIETNGKIYTVPISSAKLVEEYPNSKFSFNPRLYLGIDGGIIINSPIHAEITPNIGLSFFSYGKTKVSPQWSFATLGLGYSTQQKDIVLILSPINYNIGKDIPLIDNLYIGPSFSVDVYGNLGLYLGVKVAL